MFACRVKTVYLLLMFWGRGMVFWQMISVLTATCSSLASFTVHNFGWISNRICCTLHCREKLAKNYHRFQCLNGRDSLFLQNSSTAGSNNWDCAFSKGLTKSACMPSPWIRFPQADKIEIEAADTPRVRVCCISFTHWKKILLCCHGSHLFPWQPWWLRCKYKHLP